MALFDRPRRWTRKKRKQVDTSLELIDAYSKSRTEKVWDLNEVRFYGEPWTPPHKHVYKFKWSMRYLECKEYWFYCDVCGKDEYILAHEFWYVDPSAFPKIWAHDPKKIYKHLPIPIDFRDLGGL